MDPKQSPDPNQPQSEPISNQLDTTWPWPQFPRGAKRNYNRLGHEELTGWEGDFLYAYARSGVIRAGAQNARVAYNTVQRARRTNGAFAEAYAEAREMAIDLLEHAAWTRAIEGVTRKKAVYYKGKKVEGSEQEVTEYSDGLLKFLLIANRPERYRETIDHNHNVNLAIEEARRIAEEKGLDVEAVIAETKRLLGLQQ